MKRKRKKEKKKKIPGLFGLVILIISLLLNAFLLIGNQSAEKPEEFLVNNVLDGDTFVIKKNQRVRLFDFNAPAIDACGGQKSKDRLEELVLNKKISLREIRADKYSRIMALAYQGKQLINETMIAEGWGDYIGPQTSQAQRLRQLHRQAKEERLGIYSPECYQTENLDNPECIIKGNFHEITSKKTYFFPGCSNYSRTIIEKFNGDQWFCTEKEAQKAGFKKSGDCHGKTFK